jgi:predicted metalloprotease with PDZ domain
MRRLWAGSGGGPIAEDDIVAAVADLGGAEVAADLRRWVHGTDDLPLAPLLRGVGVTLQPEAAPGLAAALGLRVAEGAVSGVQVRQVLRGGAAERAGVAAGDELLAVDGWRVRRLDDAQQWLTPAAPFELLLARDQRVHRVEVTPPSDPARPLRLVVDDGAPAAALAARRAWLRG